MATTAGANVVSNNLIFSIDFGNAKSWDNTQNYARNMVQQNPVNVDLVGGSGIVNANGYLETTASSEYAQAGRVVTPGTGPFSVGFLYRMRSQGRGGLFERSSESTNAPTFPGWSLGQGGTTSWKWGVTDSASIKGFQSVDFTFPTLNVWYYDVGTYSGAGSAPVLNAYRNGEYVDTHTMTAAIGSLDVRPRIPLLIGNRDLVTGHNLDVQLVHIYDKELSATEIKQNYDALAHRF
jgi:hypothetical protein